MKRIPIYLLLFSSLAFMSSCASNKDVLSTSKIVYQSVRPVEYRGDIPDDAKISVAFEIHDDGYVDVFVCNRTDEIMIIDQTMSFLNANGTSLCYYDPTVTTTTNTVSSSHSSGASVNLGAVAGALGIGGIAGTLMSGINVGGGNTVGESETLSTVFKDQPRIALAPRGAGRMSKTFKVGNLGQIDMQNFSRTAVSMTEKDSNCTFSVCISYSLDEGESFDRIITDFYANSMIVSRVMQHGKVNDALREIYRLKPDALYEPWFVLKSVNNKWPEDCYTSETEVFHDYR